MMKTSLFAPGILIVCAAALGCDRGGGAPGPEAAESAPAELETQEVMVVGKNYCLGCALKKSEGAAAQCSKFGHRHALEVESATGADGEPLAGLAGASLHYLDNDRSEPLITGEEFHGERVQVKGKLFASGRTLQVEEVEPL